MNEDETFIRAIQAAPRERLPRLVYADWLDERGDPRAEFLRLQCEVVKSVQRLGEIRGAMPNEWAERVELLSQTFVVYRMPLLRAEDSDATVYKINVAAWQELNAGETLMEIETEKAHCGLPIEFDCVVIALLVEVGRSVRVDTPLALLLRV
jgi:uncharacterized protein (TIGR02996 family)